jgi:hypothetical protein
MSTNKQLTKLFVCTNIIYDSRMDIFNLDITDKPKGCHLEIQVILYNVPIQINFLGFFI